MKKLFLLLLWTSLSLSSNAFAQLPMLNQESQLKHQTVETIYQKSNLEGIIDFSLFRDAYNAYQNAPKKKALLTIIDYSKPSTEKRFYVVDLAEQKLIFNTYVAHGVNSGKKTATKFSNIVNSRKTSLGTFLTDTTYYGSNGYSLRLDGLTTGLNDNARERYIVVHGADYANESFIKQNGYLGRSWGCPALPEKLSRQIIDTIKGGSVIYAAA
ncbi:murein L,D-transpeptidase catalytic domain family protein [Vibrio sp. CAU 1672]|uniref:murein L,D-transpeptidase catalytic domain family protein n=1 Tax=Vibrio sp. CAU 1672 TaxID=3032594 RepID=UPI0023DB05BF|nr:murein L,D-transpeptidase catalytic domain family protein [Vibrio sp. CAU 1672]MDF2153409.1 murein L,D-transpeptidase catalytic domain family protein [Vibrio sp. CAU 1672]